MIILAADSPEYVAARISQHNGPMTVVQYDPDGKTLGITSSEDWEYEQAMRARKRGRPED